MLLDIVFSLDSVITAVGMADDLAIMVTAVVVSVGIMLFSAEPISRFVNRHPTVKVLALSFLLLIGVSLIGDGLGVHVPKGYIYFAMGFSVFVEMINLRVRRRGAPVKLHTPVLTAKGYRSKLTETPRHGDPKPQAHLPDREATETHDTERERVARRKAAAALVMSGGNAKSLSIVSFAFSALIASAVAAGSAGRGATRSAACVVSVSPWLVA